MKLVLLCLAFAVAAEARFFRRGGNDIEEPDCSMMTNCEIPFESECAGTDCTEVNDFLSAHVPLLQGITLSDPPTEDEENAAYDTIAKNFCTPDMIKKFKEAKRAKKSGKMDKCELYCGAKYLSQNIKQVFPMCKAVYEEFDITDSSASGLQKMCEEHKGESMSKGKGSLEKPDADELEEYCVIGHALHGCIHSTHFAYCNGGAQKRRLTRLLTRLLAREEEDDDMSMGGFSKFGGKSSKEAMVEEMGQADTGMKKRILSASLRKAVRGLSDL